MMPDYTRYAIYYLPPAGPLADFGAAWFGWDVVAGKQVPQPDLPQIAALTEGAAKYGFHATLKPPFRLAQSARLSDLQTAVAELARQTAPGSCAGLQLTPLGRFVALTGLGDMGAINRIAAECVTGLDRFRAPPGPDELARRMSHRLTPEQARMLELWGYPHVLGCFRFHLTLTAKLAKADLAKATETLTRLMPPLPHPFVLDQIALLGERSDGRFEELSRYALSGR